jgi:hypothetical protein
MDTSDDINLIAPCGMNCTICMHYLREKNKCPGCRGSDTNKPITRVRCKIKKCDFFNNDNNKFCFECEKYPCEKLKHIDNRYKTKYNMSMIENLEHIKNSGITKFRDNEKIRWTCNECGGIICVHKDCCYSCGKNR